MLYDLSNSSFSLVASLITVRLIEQKFGRQLLDIPNARSSHSQPTPRGGGLGFIVAFAIATLIYAVQQNTFNETAWWWTVLSPLVIVGIYDDRWNLPLTWRYLIQLFTASIAVFHFDSFPQPWLNVFGDFGQVLAIIFTIIGMTAIINFYNFMDGLDGLVAGVAAIQISFLALYTHQSMLWLLVTAIGGFLYWNWAPAKIFMGDAGSTFLGAVIAIALLNQPDQLTDSWSALMITLPIITDAIYTLICRLIKRENIFQAHRSHLYQRLQQSGLTHGIVASIYITVTIAIALLILNYGYIGAITSILGSIGLIILGEGYLRNTVIICDKL